MTGRTVYVALICTKWPGDKAYSVFDKFVEDEVYATALSPELIGSKKQAILAAVLAYEARLKGRNIARKPGIDILLYVIGERNIRRALEMAGPRDKAIVIAVSSALSSLQYLVEALAKEFGIENCCFDPVRAVMALAGIKLPVHLAQRYLVTRVAVFAATQRL